MADTATSTLFPSAPPPGQPGERTHHGERLVPGWNVDKLDIAAGMRLAAEFGYDDAESQMVVEYALMRHRRGEEDGAQRSALSGGIDLTTWYAILAAARAHAS